MVFDEGIIGLFALPWKQTLKFDNNITILLTIYNLKASHGDQGSINVNPKSMTPNDDEPIVDKPSFHENERPTNDDHHSNDQSHHSEHDVVHHPKEAV